MKFLIQTLPKFILFLFVTLFLFHSGTALAQVKVWEGEITIPTYGWLEDINPKFWAMEGKVKLSTTVKGTIVYPYTMQDHLYREKEDRIYKALFLENEFLKITCLPELGGRLHSVLDKTENKQVFHLNDVIKPSMIAMRGAFISGGVEWNAGPQVHTVTILSPVNVIKGVNEDGSAFLEISNLEKSLRTRWTVRLTLHPGKAYLDEKINISNPVDAMNPYYFWNCTAFPNRAGTRFIYPMTLGTDHNGVEFFDWPIHNGKDLSWLKNYDTWASIFAVDCGYDFFGAYNVDEDRGVVQVADRYKLSGKKAWTWGNWDFGIVSQKNLSDDDEAYIEVQSGPLPTQSDYGRLFPHESVAWQEWWYPVHGLGDGFEYATKDIAIQTIHNSNELKLRVIATGEYTDATISISNGANELLRNNMDLSPLKAKTILLSPAPQQPVEVTINTSGGSVLANFKTPLPIPKVSPPAPSTLLASSEQELTTEEKYLKALKLDLATDRINARKLYESVLAEEPGYSKALFGLAVLDVEAGLYKNALNKLEKALQRNVNDGMSWYFQGVCFLELENMEQALGSAAKAVRCFGTKSLGHDLVGRAFMRLGQHEKAKQAFQEAVSSNPEDVSAKNHLMLAAFAANNNTFALELANQRIANNPTDIVPRAVSALQNNISMEDFIQNVKSFAGEEEFEMLETSLLFADLGLFAEAEKLLQVYVESLPGEDQSPLPIYYLAYFAHLSDQKNKASDYSNKASEIVKDFVFESRREAVPILKFVLKQNPDDANAHVHIGNLYANLGRLDEAVNSWEKATDLNSSQSVPYRNLGVYYWIVKSNFKKAKVYFEKAIKIRPSDQTLYRDLAEILIAKKKPKQAIKILESTPYKKLKRADIIIMLAQTYSNEKQYDKTINLLESTPYFVNWEGQMITWDLFNRAHIERGKQRYDENKLSLALSDFESALTYPENIGVGRSDKPREAPAFYWKGKTLISLDQTQKAIAAWKSGAEGIEGEEEQNIYRDKCQQMLNTIK
jgi:tetratricopeptide (TPR) repeat protein